MCFFHYAASDVIVCLFLPLCRPDVIVCLFQDAAAAAVIALCFQGYATLFSSANSTCYLINTLQLFEQSDSPVTLQTSLRNLSPHYLSTRWEIVMNETQHRCT